MTISISFAIALAVLTALAGILAGTWRASARVANLQTREACAARHLGMENSLSSKASNEVVKDAFNLIHKLESRVAEIITDQAVIKAKLELLAVSLERLEFKLDQVLGNTPRPSPYPARRHSSTGHRGSDNDPDNEDGRGG